MRDTAMVLVLAVVVGWSANVARALPFVVTNTNDNGKGSLRDAIVRANDNEDNGNAITFDATVFARPQTIVLQGTEMPISHDLTISGPSAGLTLDANKKSRIFRVTDASTVDIVGVGTGAELFDLAAAFPQWQFTAVEPAPAMIALCRQRAQDNGVQARCAFHQGTLDSLPASAPFDGATCLLVSHFFMENAGRSEFFQQIAARLGPQGILVSADLSSAMEAPTFPALLEIWRRMLRQSGMPADQYIASLGQSAAVLPTDEVAAILRDGGFETPVLFFQSLLIHAWFSRRAAPIE